MKKCKRIVVSLLIVFSVLISSVAQVSFSVKALSNEETIFNYLTGTMGLNTAAACGVLANIQCESGFNPNALGDSGTSYGICQWHNDRWTRLKNYTSNWQTLNGQLSYLNYELSNYYSGVLNYLKGVSNTASGAYNAGYYWCYNFEIPANKASVSVTRGNLAQNTYWPKYKEPDVILEDNTSYTSLLPITAYLCGKSTVYPCERDCSTQTGGQIWSTDKCTINAIYTNGWCQVTYPTASEPKTAYTPLSNFMGSGLSQKTAPCSMDTYSRADGETRIGSVSQGDGCYITGTSGSYTQSIYPTSSGYKLGWSLSSLWNFTEPSADARFNPYCPIKGYILSGDTNQNVYESTDTSTYAGKIFPEDYCTIKAVYANGWCLVEYPAGSGTKTKYAPLGAFVHDVGCTPQKYIANKQITVRTKADMASTVNWYISSGDNFFVLSKTPATAGQIAQVLYPIDAQYGGGYKIGWIYQSDIPVYTYTVTYNANGGSGAPSAQTKYYDTNLTLSSTVPVKNGYSFIGWATNSAATSVSYGAGSVYSSNSNVTLYAVWSPNKYTVSYNANGGTAFIQSQTKVYGTDLTLTADEPSKVYTLEYNSGLSGVEITQSNLFCRFMGWSTSSSATAAEYQPGDTFKVNANITLYAVWSDPVAGELNNCSRDGYYLEGWYTQAEGGTKITSSTVISQDTTIYAHWAETTATSATIVTAADKLNYVVGETLDTTGLSLKVFYNDGTEKTVTEGFTCTPNVLNSSGEITVTVSYEGAAAEFTVIVNDRESSATDKTPGDTNDDGTINLKDVVVLQRWLAGGWAISINSQNADVNNDEKVNLKDVVVLQRYLAGGWGIDLGYEPETPPDEPEVVRETEVYGYSERGRELVCYKFTPKEYDRTVLLNFAIHGFEDDYDHDGQLLVDAANYLIDYYNECDDLHNCRLIIVPCANPDGLYDGNTNNGFGRCNANGVDLNRDFDANYISYSSERNYTPYAFSAAESRALRDLCLEYDPDVVCDMHGWLNTTIGDAELAEVFYQELGLSHQVGFTSSNCRGYFANWAHQQGALGLLVEFTDTNIPKANLLNAVKRLVAGDYDNGSGSYTEDENYAAFTGGISCYTLSNERTTTYAGFDVPFSTISYIEGSTDLCVIEKIYENEWVKVTYPISSGNKTAYCPLSAFIAPDSEVDHYTATVSGNTTVYRRSDMSETIGSVWSTDVFTVIARSGNAVQIIYPLDNGGWKMGWISASAVV